MEVYVKISRPHGVFLIRPRPPEPPSTALESSAAATRPNDGWHGALSTVRRDAEEDPGSVHASQSLLWNLPSQGSHVGLPASIACSSRPITETTRIAGVHNNHRNGHRVAGLH